MTLYQGFSRPVSVGLGFLRMSPGRRAASSPRHLRKNSRRLCLGRSSSLQIGQTLFKSRCGWETRIHEPCRRSAGASRIGGACLLVNGLGHVAVTLTEDADEERPGLLVLREAETRALSLSDCCRAPPHFSIRIRNSAIGKRPSTGQCPRGGRDASPELLA